MGIIRKLRKNEKIGILRGASGKRPKHRCPMCGKMTLYVREKEDKDLECVWCQGDEKKARKIKKERNKKFYGND